MTTLRMKPYDLEKARENPERAPNDKANDDCDAASFVELRTENEVPERRPIQAAAEVRKKSDDPIFSFLTDMKADLASRLPLYWDDWSRPNSVYTVFNATVFAFVIQLIPALIFADAMARSTFGSIGVAEVILSSALMGIIYSIFAGQPIVILGITGPVAILVSTSYGLAEAFQAQYFSFFFWTCIWAGLMHCLSSMVGLVSLVWKVSPFTSQIFELFIAISFIYTAIFEIFQPLQLTRTENDERTSHYSSLIIASITFYVAWTLRFADASVYFTRQTRIFAASYNTLIAVIIGTAFSYLPGVATGLDRVEITPPWNWQPTSNRPWLVSPFQGIGPKGIFGAIIPGFMFFLLFIIDHNVSSILTQSPKFNLKKPHAYHWDFFILGLTFVPCAVLGLPPGNGLIPQAPLHARALCKREFREDEHGVKREFVLHIEEQRWSAFGQSILMLLSLLAFEVISWIPRGCLFGLLLYLGASTLHGNEIYERLMFNFILAKKRPKIPVVLHVRWSTVQLWTAIQFMCAVSILHSPNSPPLAICIPPYWQYLYQSAPTLSNAASKRKI